MHRDMHRQLGGWLYFLPALPTPSRPCLRAERVQRSGALDIEGVYRVQEANATHGRGRQNVPACGNSEAT